MWWDLALRLSYPGRLVAGVYFESDHRDPPGFHASFSKDKLHLQSKFPLHFYETDASHLLIFDWSNDKQLRLLQHVPEWLAPGVEALEKYRPGNLIEHVLPDSRAIRRYGPLPAASIQP